MTMIRLILVISLPISAAFAQANPTPMLYSPPPNPGKADAIYWHTKLPNKIYIDKNGALVAVDKGELTTRTISSCSKINYNCVNIATTLFAVPIKGLHPDQKYRIHGMEFNVLSCLDVDGKCRVSEITAECKKSPIDKSPCAYNQSDLSLRFDKICFIYSTDNGVVFFSFPKAAEKMNRSCFTKNGGYVLVSGRWML